MSPSLRRGLVLHGFVLGTAALLLPLAAAVPADPPPGQKYALPVGVHQYGKNRCATCPTPRTM